MRHFLRLFVVSCIAILCLGEMVMAQTSSRSPTKRELMRQDSEECAKQAPRLYVEPFAECIFKRQAARKAAAQQERAARRAKRKQEADAARQARREQTRKQIEQIKADRAKTPQEKQQQVALQKENDAKANVALKEAVRYPRESARSAQSEVKPCAFRKRLFTYRKLTGPGH